MTSLTLWVMATESSLPTAWLAPPPGLVPPNQAVKITPIPMSISATITLIIVCLVVILFSRKSKEVFLADKIVSSQQSPNPNPTSSIPPIPKSHPGISTPAAGRVPGDVQRPISQIPWSTCPQPYTAQVPTFDYSCPHDAQNKPAWRTSERNANGMLGIDSNCNPGRRLPRQTSPGTFRTCGSPGPSGKHVYDSDDETLNDDEKNSAYVPFTGSDYEHVNGKVWKRPGGVDDSHLPEHGPRESVDAHGSNPFQIARKSQLGDAY